MILRREVGGRSEYVTCPRATPKYSLRHFSRATGMMRRLRSQGNAHPSWELWKDTLLPLSARASCIRPPSRFVELKFLNFPAFFRPRSIRRRAFEFDLSAGRRNLKNYEQILAGCEEKRKFASELKNLLKVVIAAALLMALWRNFMTGSVPLRALYAFFSFIKVLWIIRIVKIGITNH